jgi:hypothetical protein
MRHEKIIKDYKREIIIIIELQFQHGFLDYGYYVTDLDGKVISDNNATSAEILEAKLELWNLIKPC